MKREELSIALEDSAEIFARRYLPNGVKSGNSWTCGSIAGDKGTSFSMMMTSTGSARAGYWQDFSTGESGGLIEIVAHHERFNLSDDAEYKAATTRCLEVAAKKHLVQGPSVKRSLIPPTGTKACPRPFGADYWHEYKDADGNPMFSVARYEGDAKKKKMFAPYSWYGDEGWGKGLTIKTNRTPYRLNHLLKDGPILVVEGELKADLAASVLPPNWSTLAWFGGADNVGKNDWSCLKGRSVHYWPDNDDAGIKCRNNFNDIAKNLTSELYSVTMQPHFPVKFDVKDAIQTLGMSEEQIMAIIGNSEKHDGMIGGTDEHYEPLGFRNGIYHFIKTATFEEVALAPSSFSKNTLMHLAPLEFWKENFPSRKTDEGFSLSAAADFLMRQCEAIGRYDPFLVRGVGVWPSLMDGKPVTNTGSMVYHEGKKYSLPGAFEAGHGRFVRSKEIGDMHVAPPMDDAMAIQIANYFKTEVLWDKKCDAYLMAGWVAIAPIASYLKFRPHLWITAARGAGKSAIMEMIMQPLFSNYASFIGAGSTESAIRQELKRDATPVIYDEAENGMTRGVNRTDVMLRMKSILQLARLSATASGVRIIKGSSTGDIQEYSCQSAMAFLSILPSLEDSADIQRFIVVEPSKRNSANGRVLSEAAKAFSQRLTKTPNLTLRFLRRQIEMMPLIEKAMDCFQKEFSDRKMPSRYGQLYGTVLAGLLSLETPMSAMNSLPNWESGGFYAKIVNEIGLIADTAEDYEEDETNNFIENFLSMGIRVDGGHEESVMSLWDNALTDPFARRMLSHYGLARHGNFLCIQKRVPNQMLKHIRELGYTERTWHYMLKRHPAYNKDLRDKVSFGKVLVDDYYAINVNKVLPNRASGDTTTRATHISERNLNENSGG